LLNLYNIRTTMQRLRKEVVCVSSTGKRNLENPYGLVPP